MRSEQQTTGRALVVSFAAVALTFTVGIAVAQLYMWRVRLAARQITDNSSPSVSRLSSMRAALRVLEVQADDYVDRCQVDSCGPAPARLEELRATLRTDWRGYRELPVFPREAEAWPGIEEALAQLDGAFGDTFGELRKGRPTQAEEMLERNLKPACDRLDGMIARLVKLNFTQGIILASRIEALSGISIALSVVLDLASVALTALAGALAIRVVRRYERSLQSRADELDLFAGRVAHDVMSPLMTTDLALQVARRHASDDGRAVLEQGRRGIQRVRLLVDGLLEFARAGAKLVPGVSADVRGVVDAVSDELRPLAEQRGVSVLTQAAPGASVACSPGLLMSLVANLVRNAIVHMGASEVRRVVIRASRVSGEEWIRIEVEDTGPGVPAALGDRIFEPFVRGNADEPGSGLGLATVRRIVTAHRGGIGHQSRPGGGALFWIVMPRAAHPGEPVTFGSTTGVRATR